jgi:pyruvate kinase
LGNFQIIKLSDGIMVARGDLGVEMSPWDVPIIQKQIVQRCRALGKPVVSDKALRVFSEVDGNHCPLSVCMQVIATQMMESMIENPTPTRAEASDCATAVYDLSDAVMLSGRHLSRPCLTALQVINILFSQRRAQPESFLSNP